MKVQLLHCVPYYLYLEEKLASRLIIISHMIIIPPLTKSSMDIVFEGTFLLTTKAIIDIARAAAPPKLFLELALQLRILMRRSLTTVLSIFCIKRVTTL